MSEKPIEQPKVTAKVPIQVLEYMIKLCLYQITKFLKQDLVMIQVLELSKKKTIWDISSEIQKYPDPVYRLSPKPVEIPIQKVPRNLSDFDPEINDFKENSPFQEGVISET